MKTSDFSYELPEELIAQTPTDRRDESRLLVCERGSGEITHSRFFSLPDFLNPGDCLILNNSKVLPARLLGERETGGAAEVLLLRDLGGNKWECLVKPGKALRAGSKLVFGEGKLTCEVLTLLDHGLRVVEFSYSGIWHEILYELGAAPLPPYIKESPKDPGRYQTVYAKTEGSAAAPTAGLHFTNELLDKIREIGVSIAEVTLHVGLGTFRPVVAENAKDHEMHTEYYEIPKETAEIINLTRERNGRVIAVGTTSCRTLESAEISNGLVKPSVGETGIFITPGYEFKLTDALITNFHLPKSTLLMLVSAFYNREKMLEVYETAVKERYRFFSFGDAMMLI